MSVDWEEVFKKMKDVKINFENKKEVINWLFQTASFFRKVDSKEELSPEAWALVLKYALRYLLLENVMQADFAYSKGSFHPWILTKVLVYGIELKSFAELYEILEKGLRAVYETCPREVFLKLVSILLGTAMEAFAEKDELVRFH